MASANLFRTRKVAKICATFSGTSSWIAWPACGRTCIWNLPCICPTVRSLSSLSTPAKTNILAAGTLKNLADSPANQPVQCRSVLPKSIRQVYEGFTELSGQPLTAGGLNCFGSVASPASTSSSSVIALSAAIGSLGWGALCRTFCKLRTWEQSKYCIRKVVLYLRHWFLDLSSHGRHTAHLSSFLIVLPWKLLRPQSSELDRFVATTRLHIPKTERFSVVHARNSACLTTHPSPCPQQRQ